MTFLKIAICVASGEPVLQPWHLTLRLNDLSSSMPTRLCSTVYRSFQATDPLNSFADDCIRFWGYVRNEWLNMNTYWELGTPAPREVALFSLVRKRLGGVDCDLPSDAT